MNIVKNLDQYDENNLFFCDPIKNNVMNEGKFMRILYSNELFVLNGIYLVFTIYTTHIDKYYNKYKLTFDRDMHSSIVSRLQYIEHSVLSHSPIKHKMPQYKIYDQLKNNHIKIFIDPKQTITTSANVFLLKISGIWETDANYGVTYKFIKMNSTPI